MSNNGANNEQWRMAGSKKNNIGGVRHSEKQDEHNDASSNEGDQGLAASTRKEQPQDGLGLMKSAT
jgi:hypothetical protein